MEEKIQKYELCNVGLFNLPGIVYDKGSISDEEHQEMVEWATEYNCGKAMTNELWSFKSESQRDWFLLKWGDKC